MQESSIGVFPKETELHVLLKQRWRGWLHPNYHLEGCDCHRDASPRGCHHQRCDRKSFWENLPILSSLLYHCCTIFPLSSLSAFKEAHPLCLCACVAVSSKDNSVVLHTSSSASTVQTDGRGDVAWRALGARSVQSTTHGSHTRGGSSVQSRSPGRISAIRWRR